VWVKWVWDSIAGLTHLAWAGQLAILVRGRSRSWKWRHLIDHIRLTISLLLHSSSLYRFLSYLMLNNVMTLKSPLEVTHGHSKWYYLKAWVQFPIDILTMAISLAVSEILNIKLWHDLEIWVGSYSRSLKMAPISRWYTTYYWSAIVSILYLLPFLRHFTLTNITTLKSRLEVTQDHSKWNH